MFFTNFSYYSYLSSISLYFCSFGSFFTEWLNIFFNMQQTYSATNTALQEKTF